MSSIYRSEGSLSNPVALSAAGFRLPAPGSPQSPNPESEPRLPTESREPEAGSRLTPYIHGAYILHVTNDRAEIDALLPLPAATFHILIALADEERHGYAVIQDVAARTGGEVRLSAGTLYRSIQRMQEQGLIEESRRRPAPDEDDERRRYYRITPFGTAVARAEARRLTQLVDLARASGFAPRKA